MADSKQADEGYNGWTNRATWNVALWLENDWSTELAEWQRNTRIKSATDLREAIEHTIEELAMQSWMLQHPSGKGAAHFLTPDAERFEDADWDELYEYLVKEPRKELDPSELEDE